MAEETKEEKKDEVKEEVTEKPAEDKKAEPTGAYADLIKKIEDLSVKDLAALVKELEDRFGVSAAAPMMAAAGPAAAGAASAGADEKSEYSIVLADAGAQKIAVIKAVREVRPDLGLKEAKDLVDGAPKEIKPNVPKDEAQAAKEKLEAAGAKVELK
jgi:large subunit ribosomal protein L7/L12